MTSKIITIALSLLACMPLETEDYQAVHHECNEGPDDLRCYVHVTGWSAWAHTIERSILESYEEDGGLISARQIRGYDCWSAPSDLAPTVCLIGLDGLEVAGVPLTDATGLEPDASCASAGPWVSLMADVDHCYAVVDGFAVLLDVERPIP